MNRVLKPKRCKACRDEFAPRTSMQVVCFSPICAQAYVQAKRFKEEQRQDRKKLQAMKKPSHWLGRTEDVVNKYVRLRDFHYGCVSCHLPQHWGGQWHASHFRSVGAASAVRFHLWNIHKSCSVCNNHKSGNLAEYEPSLRARIGDAKVDWLRTQNQIVTYSIEYLARLRRVFAKKTRRLERRLRESMLEAA